MNADGSGRPGAMERAMLRAADREENPLPIDTAPDTGRLAVRVRSIVYQGESINQYEVVDPDGGELPPFKAGDHIDLYFRDGRVRQYSLCNDPTERHRYRFTVLREEDGRGGSKAIFHLVHVGRILRISPPRSSFSLVEDAGHHLLIAGGIGITPIMSMAYRLATIGADFELHYCTRSSQRTAFRDELAHPRLKDHVRIYHDGGVPGRGVDIDDLLRDYRTGMHLYYCGPTGLMHAVTRASRHWPPGTTHFELFKPSQSPHPVSDLLPSGDSSGVQAGFRVRLGRSGREFAIPGDKSIVEVLRENGIDVPTSCEAGLCGTCRTRYLDGTPEHRDYVLDEEEQREFVLICCCRSRSPLLVLDL
jgi:vanillate O-demethylase ferredoxin subunit